jgi:hypothetical protein
MPNMFSLFPQDAPVSKDLLRKHLVGPVANVQGFGARGDGIVDDTESIQAAIDYVSGHGGGIVYLPAGTYKIMPQASVAMDRTQANALHIAADNVVLTGDGPALTRLSFRVFGDRDPTDSYELYPWYSKDGSPDVWRGSAIFVIGGDDPSRPRRDIAIENLEIDGGVRPGNTWDRTVPAGKTGEGWDISHKGINLQEGRHHRRIAIRNVHAHDFRGEIVFGGGDFIDEITIEDCELHGTNADCLSLTASQTVRGCRFYDAAHACIESGHSAKLVRYAGNQLSYARIGLNIQTAWDSPHPAEISDNLFTECADQGISLNAENGTTLISDNKFIDCGHSQSQHASLAIEPGRGQTAPAVGGIIVRDNHFLRHNRDGGAGIALTCKAGRKLKSVVISGNFIGSSAAGLERGKRFLVPITYGFAAGADVDGVHIIKNIYYRPQRHVDNTLAKSDGSGPMPAMSDNQAIGFEDAGNNTVVVDEHGTVRLPNEGPVALMPTGQGEPIMLRLNPTDYAQGQKLILTNGSPARRIYLPQTSALFECREGRHISPGVFIALVRDGDKFREVDYEDRRSRHYAEVTDGTDIAADGFADVYVAVPSERRFVTFSGIGHGARVRVIATNRNVTIANNEQIQLHSNADYEMVEHEVKNFMRTRDGILREI